MKKNLNLIIVIAAMAIIALLFAGCQNMFDNMKEKSYNVDVGFIGLDGSTAVDPATGALLPAIKAGDINGNTMSHKTGDGDNIYFRQDKSFWGSEVGSTVVKVMAQGRKKVTISSIAKGQFDITIDEAAITSEAETDSGVAMPLTAKAKPLVIIRGQVIDVHDGDTCKVVCDDGKTRIIRLYGIDAPELKQAYGPESRDKLASLILNKAVELQITGKDAHEDRDDAWIKIDNVLVNLAMVGSGCAWAYPQYIKTGDRAAFGAAQTAAQNGKLGLWSADNPIVPWEYRKGKR